MSLANSSTNSGRSGRGPIRLISPLSTLSSCGSSSSQLRRTYRARLRRGADPAILAVDLVDRLREPVGGAAAKNAPCGGEATQPLRAPRRGVAPDEEFQRARAVLLRRRLAGGEAHRAKLVEV